MLTLSAQIESILFTRTEGVTFTFLSKLLVVSASEIETAVEKLRTDLTGRGIKVLVSSDTVMLTTHESMSDILAPLYDEAQVGDLSPAALQTLSIILYKGGATKSEISYIRGVDSRMSIRSLMIRGIIERAQKETYIATADSLRYLGVSRVEDLPRFEAIRLSLTKELSQETIETKNV